MDIEEQWIEDVLALSIGARTNVGVSDSEVASAIGSTEALSKKYKGKDFLPMDVVNVLIDLQSGLISSGVRHREEFQNEAMAKKIFEVALRLSDIARDMTG